MRPLTVSEVARQASVNPATVRFYERKKLLPSPSRTAAGYRHYPAEAVRRLRFIKHAQELGFTLKEIEQLLNLTEQRATSAEVCAVTAAKIAAIDEKIRQLRKFRSTLQRLTDSCNKRGSTQDCVIIRHFYA